MIGRVRVLTITALAWTLSPFFAAAQVPVKVEKVEPPNWWIGLQNPMLLLKGEGLTDAKVTSSRPGVRVSRIENGLNGKYLFVWLEVAKTVPAAEVTLTVSAAGTTAKLPYRFLHETNAPIAGLSAEDVIYRVPFAGSAQRIREQLPLAKAVGATVVSVPSAEATAPEVRSLVEAAHAQGLKMLLDLNENSVEPDDPLVQDPPQANWFHGTKESHLAAPDDLLPLADPHATARMTRRILEGWVRERPDLNTDSPWTSLYLREKAIWWAESTGVDGFTMLETANVDRKFWHDLHGDLNKALPKLATVAESGNWRPDVAALFAAGGRSRGPDAGFHSIDDFSLGSLLVMSAAGESLQRLPIALQEDALYPEGINLVVGFEDQPSTNIDSRRLAFSLLATMRGIPEMGPVAPELQERVQTMLKLRREHAALRSGKLYNIFSDPTMYAFERDFVGTPKGLGTAAMQTERLLVVVNNGDQSRKGSFEVKDTPIETVEKLNTVYGKNPAAFVNGKIEMEVPARSIAIYEVLCGCDLR